VNKFKEGEVRLEKTAKTVESASKRHPVQTIFWFSLVVIPVVLVALAPYLHIKEDGWLQLTRMQLGYALVSIELAVVVYMYGVGSWSRFEPPTLPPGAAAGASSNSPDAKPTVVPAAVVSPQTAPPQAGTPGKPQGGQ
jgi:hypothetical protein